jgi:hypothetical protein
MYDTELLLFGEEDTQSDTVCVVGGLLGGIEKSR